ncbi:MAG TPA: alpha/beta hydrolase [Propionicimonas sp.]|nr:alpha/beta hydrolase [Propionicimonas sp.]
MYYVEVGSGMPVLAIHGWMPDHRLMRGCLEPVFARRAGYRRLYPDLPGMGRSPAGSVASADDLLAALEEFIDAHIGIDRFLLVGESYGGYLARALVRSRPDQVAGLAMIAPVAEPRPDRRVLPALQVLRADPGVLDGLDTRLQESFTFLAAVHTAEVLHRFLDEVQPGLDAADQVALARIGERLLLSRDPDAPGQEPFLGPSVTLVGRQDIAVGYQDQWRLLTRYPRMSLAALDTAGHNVQIEQPQLFEALMVEWLDRVAAQR